GQGQNSSRRSDEKFPRVSSLRDQKSSKDLVQNLAASCGCRSGVIGVQAALYGRADSEICSQGMFASQTLRTNCSQQGFQCDGKRECELSQNVVRTSDPCFGTYKYIDTTYACFPARHIVVCETSYLNLRCDEGQVLFVYSADYGRHDRTTCSFDRPAVQVQNVQCSLRVNKVAERCNGKSSCTIQATNSEFGDPCVGTYKYLEVYYTCHCECSSFTHELWENSSDAEVQ
uniref:SUEL-type lectin domain-containing protein n=1 Tax=Anabas testudineus TaxID=64144 RepID=A0A3Q1JKQ7_ANATE